MTIEQLKPVIDNFNSKKFITLIITLAIYVMVFIGAWANKLLTTFFLEVYLAALVITTGLYFGVNLLESKGVDIAGAIFGKKELKQ